MPSDWPGGMTGSTEVLAECPADLRAWEWRYLKQSSSREPLAFIGHTGEVWDAAISPDGRRLASASFDHTIKLWDVATGQARADAYAATRKGPTASAFDKDGTRLVSASADKTAIIWDVASGKALHVLRGHVDNVRCAVVQLRRPHRRHRELGRDASRLERMDRASCFEPVRHGAGWITRVAFSPDSRWVAVGGSSGRAEVVGHLLPAASLRRSRANWGPS